MNALAVRADKTMRNLKTTAFLIPAALVTLFLVLGGAYSIVNPIHEGTDEIRHYRFVRSLAVNKSLPVQGEEPCRSQSHHPPLIYALGALATGWIDTGRGICENPAENPFWGYRYWEPGTDNKNLYLHGPQEAFPWYGEALAAHLVRFLNVAIGAAAVLLTYLAARTLWPRRRGLALGAVAFIAFNPMFLYMAATINNDVVAALSGAAVIYASVRLLHSKQGLTPRWGIAFGGIYGLALLSKFNLLPVILIIELAITWVAWRRRQWRLWVTVNAGLFLTAGILAGWWFWRNYALYGDPTGFQEVTELWGVRTPSESVGLVIQELPQAWSSLWGRFGYGQIPLPSGIYRGLAWLSLVAVTGLLAAPFLRPRSGRATVEAETPPHAFAFSIILLALMVLGFSAVLISYMLVSPAGAMGRFFFPGLPALSILLFYGLYSWFAALGNTGRGTLAFALGVDGIMLILALVALFGYLRPAYAAPERWTAATPLPNATSIQFDSIAKLRGYRLSQDTLTTGETIEIDLYWEVLNQPPGEYWLFVHLIDEVGSLVAQRDTHPGAGKFPTTQWRPGDRFIDTVQLPIPDTAYPGRATISVGLYAPDAYRLAVTEENGALIGDALVLDEVSLVAAAGDFPNSQDFNFGNYVRLVGYQYDTRRVAPGEAITVTLYWEMLTDDLDGQVSRVRVHSAAHSEQEWSDNSLQKRRPPGGQDRIITDVHTLRLDEDAPPDFYTISVYLFDIFTEKQVNIVADDGHWIDNELELAKIHVVDSVEASSITTFANPH